MSAALRLLVRFLLWTLLLLIAGSLFIVAYRFVVGYEEGQARSGVFLVSLLSGVGRLLIPAVLVGSVISLFDLIRESVSPKIGLPLLFLAWSGALAGGSLLLELQPLGQDTPVPSVPSGRIIRYGTIALYVGNVSGDAFEPVVVHDTDGYVVVDSGRIDPARSVFTVGDRQFPLAQLGNTYSSVVDPPRAILGLASDSEASAEYLGLLQGVTGLMHLAGLSLFLLGCWTLVRLTRWPLFNLVGVLLALRFALWIIPAVNQGALRPLVIAATSSLALPYVSAGLLGGLGLALFFTAALLSPLESFKREIAG